MDFGLTRRILLCEQFLALAVQSDAMLDVHSFPKHPTQSNSRRNFLLSAAPDVRVASYEPHLVDVLLFVPLAIFLLEARHGAIAVPVELTPCGGLKPRASFVQGKRMTNMFYDRIVAEMRQHDGPEPAVGFYRVPDTKEVNGARSLPRPKLSSCCLILMNRDKEFPGSLEPSADIDALARRKMAPVQQAG